MEPVNPNGEILVKIVSEKMPFGKYKGVVYSDLPVPYLEWFSRNGFPKGSVGTMLATIYEIKINGLTFLLDPIKQHLKKN